MKFFNHKKTKAGFTLIEMMVAVFVFSVVMVLATGAIFSIVSANKTSQALKSVMDNLSSALDSMSREVRYGTVYNCGNTTSGTDFTVPFSCSEGSADNAFAFSDKFGVHVIYEFRVTNSSDQSGSIYRCPGDNYPDGCVPLTAPEVHIKNLHFYVQGAEADELQKPLLLITISGYAQAGSSIVNRAEFNIETMVDQRNSACKNSMVNCQ